MAVVKRRKPSYNSLITIYDSIMEMSGLRSTAIGGVALTFYNDGITQAIFPVIIPHIKHASSRAIAVLATLELLPLLSTIL